MGKRVLVVVDMQNDFITGSLGSKDALNIVPRVCKKIREVHDDKGTVIFTMDTHYDDYENSLEGKKLPVRHCISGTEGHNLYPTIFDETRFGDIFFEKYTFGCSEMIDTLLFDDKYRFLSIDEFELCGVCTDICVISNALLIREAFPDTPIKVDATACAGTNFEAHMAALKVMQSCQIDVI